MTSQDSSSATEENWPIKRCKCHRAQLCIIKRAHTPRNYGRLYYCSTCDNHPICNGFVDWVSDHLKLLVTQCMEDEQMYRRRNGRTTNESRDVQRANIEEEDSVNTRVSFEQVELAKLKEQMQDFKFWQKFFPIAAVYIAPTVLESVRKAQEETSAMILSRALQLCKEKMVKAETLTLMGDPKDMICQAAEQMHVDLLVVGSRGLSKIKRAFLGSVSDYCAHHAKCPILIVKPPKESNKK